jgi:hypothetical protein
MVARVAVQLEREGFQVFSEREIFARERAAGKRIFSAAIAGRRFHRPDLIVPADSAEAIEVELTAKAAPRLDGILRAWRRAILEGKVGRVRYECSERTIRGIRRSIERARAQQFVDSRLLRSLE